MQICDAINDKAKQQNSMSQSLWQIGRPTLNASFFETFFFSLQHMCQVWVGHNLGPIQNMELDFWMNKIQD